MICDDPADQRYPAISGDLVVWQDHRNHNTTGVPEPVTLSLLALGGLALIRRRR